jgi:hypothetical protein
VQLGAIVEVRGQDEYAVAVERQSDTHRRPLGKIRWEHGEELALLFVCARRRVFAAVDRQADHALLRHVREEGLRLRVGRRDRIAFAHEHVELVASRLDPVIHRRDRADGADLRRRSLGRLRPGLRPGGGARTSRRRTPHC